MWTLFACSFNWELGRKHGVYGTTSRVYSNSVLMSSSSIGATASRWTGKWVILMSDVRYSLVTFRSLATSEVPYEANLSLLRRSVLHLFLSVIRRQWLI